MNMYVNYEINEWWIVTPKNHILGLGQNSPKKTEFLSIRFFFLKLLFLKKIVSNKVLIKKILFPYELSYSLLDFIRFMLKHLLIKMIQ